MWSAEIIRVASIGVGRFWILGGQSREYWVGKGAGGGANILLALTEEHPHTHTYTQIQKKIKKKWILRIHAHSKCNNRAKTFTNAFK